MSLRREYDCPPPKMWAVEASYTAVCPPGSQYPGTATVTRQARSFVSLDHARAVARRLAKAEAEAELKCFIATRCMTPVCGTYFNDYAEICRSATGKTQVEANAAAQALVAQAVGEFCGFIDSETGEVLIDSETGLPFIDS